MIKIFAYITMGAVVVLIGYLAYREDRKHARMSGTSQEWGNELFPESKIPAAGSSQTTGRQVEQKEI